MRIVNFDDGYTSATAPVADLAASSVAVTPTGDLSSTNVQTALVELQGDIDAAEAAHTAHLADLANPHAVTKTQVGLSNVTNDAQIPLSQKGAVSGVAELDSGGYLPLARIPVSLLGAVRYQGTWDATANSPALVSSVGTQGYYYVVGAGGGTNLNGITSWVLGDWAIFNGVEWQKIDNTDAVISVAGQTGIVTLAKGDVGLGNVDNTSDATKNAASATLTNKTLTSPSLASPTISDYELYTESSAPSTPASGKVALYAKSDKKLYTKDSAGTETQVGASGSGEINAITTGSTDATGWLAGTSHAVATDTSNSPLSPITTTCIKITATANGTESSTSGGYKTLTLPTSLLSRKLKVEFYVTTPASDTWRLSVYQGTTRLALTTDSSSVTSLPASVTTKYTAYFDANTSTGYTYSLTRTAGSGTTSAYLTSLIVGPGIQPQGAVVTESTAWTPTGTWTTNTTYTGFQRRDGNVLDIEVQVATAGAPTAATFKLNIPTGLTIDTSKLTNSTGDQNYLGDATILDSGTNYFYAKAFYSTTTQIGFTVLRASSSNVDGTTAITETSPMTFATGDRIWIRARVPIAEWAGSGTVNLAQNDVQWAADDGSADVFGPNGALVPNQTATTLTTQRGFSFTGGKQDGDQYLLEVNYRGNGWNSAADVFPFFQGNNASSSNYYGMSGLWTSSTVFTVYFGNQGTAVSASNATAGASPWSAEFTAGTRFRVRKVSSGAAVGFGEVNPGVSSGLVSASGLKGATAGTAIAAGYVGEVLTATQATTTAPTGNSYGDVTSLVLTAGVWMLTGYIRLDRNSSTSSCYVGAGFGTVSGNNAPNQPASFNLTVQDLSSSVSTTGWNQVNGTPAPHVFTTTGTTVYLKGLVSQTSGTLQWSGRLNAVRIA